MGKLLISAVLLSFILLALSTPIALADNSTAFLKMQFNETTGSVALNEGLTGDGDDPQGAFNGSIISTVTLNQAGKNSTFNSSFDFGGGRVEVGDISSVFAQGREDFSICFWMNPDTWTANAVPISVYGGDSPGAQDGYRLQQSGTDGVLFLIYEDSNNEQITHTFNGGSPVGKWTQVCILRQDTNPGTTANLTVIENNYEKQTTGLVTSRDVFTGLSPLCVGVRCNNNDRAFDGRIDHVYYWNFTINESFVEAHYGGYDFGAVSAAPVIPEPQPEINVSILFPLNATNQTQDPLNLTFQYVGENASFCGLYSNITGGFTHIANLTAGIENVTIVTSTPKNISRFAHSIGTWRMEGKNTSLITDLNGNFNLTNTGSWSRASKGTNKTGIYSRELDGSVPNSMWYPDADNFSFGDGSTDQAFSFGCWIYPHSFPFRIVGKRAGTTNTEYFFTIDGSGFPRVQIFDDSTGAHIGRTSPVITTNNWYHFVMTYDGSKIANGVNIYQNGVEVDNLDTTSGAYTAMENTDAIFEIGSINNRTTTADGFLDECFLYRQELSTAKINEILNQGVFNATILNSSSSELVQTVLNQSTNYSLGHDIPTDTTTHIEETILCSFNETVTGNQTFVYFYNNDFTPPVITVLSPQLGGNVTNINIDINISTNEFSTCSLNNGNWSLASSNNTFFFFEDQGANSSKYFITITCSDVAENSAQEIINFTKDVVQPIITTTVPSEFNDSVISNTGSISFYTNITDDFGIFGYVYNITDFATGTLYYNQNESGVTGLTRIISPTVNTGNWSNSSVLVSVFACDSHTARELSQNTKNMQVNKRTKGIDMVIGKGLHRTTITVESLGGGEQSTDVINQRDRKQFVFKYAPNNNAPKKFRVTTNKNYHFMDSGFIGHAVIDGMGGHWIDFEGYGDDYEITLLDDGYEIEFHNGAGDEIVFNSIGDLNCNNEFYTFELRPVVDPFFLINTNTVQGVLLLGLLIFLWLALVIIGFMFKNIAFSAVGFAVGVICAIFLFNIHIALTILVMFLNVGVMIEKFLEK